jgi:hypothetical protein
LRNEGETVILKKTFSGGGEYEAGIDPGGFGEHLSGI